MGTTIRSNGSKWLGQEPDSVDQLVEVLKTETLDPRFEKHGGFVQRDPGGWRFFGNFLTVSHVFNITSNDPAVVKRLKAAIAENVASARYAAVRPAPDA